MTTTTVTLTGTGVPHPSPGRAGPGVLVRHGETAFQFDAGRGTVLRLTEAGAAAHELDALFITHVHSDHLVDLADLVMTRWIQRTLHPAGPLPIVAVEGESTRFARRMLDPFVDDTRVCNEVREFAAGADVLVHEACRVSVMAALTAGTPFEQMFDYHADTVALGRLAEMAGVGHLVLTHLIPPPTDAAAEQAFADDVRSGGYTGPLTVGHDLFTIELT